MAKTLETGFLGSTTPKKDTRVTIESRKTDQRIAQGRKYDKGKTEYLSKQAGKREARSRTFATGEAEKHRKYATERQRKADREAGLQARVGKDLTAAQAMKIRAGWDKAATTGTPTIPQRTTRRQPLTIEQQAKINRGYQARLAQRPDTSARDARIQQLLREAHPDKPREPVRGMGAYKRVIGYQSPYGGRTEVGETTEDSARRFESGQLGVRPDPSRTLVPGTTPTSSRVAQLGQAQTDRAWRAQGIESQADIDADIQRQLNELPQKTAAENADMDQALREAALRGQQRAIGDTADMKEHYSMFLDDADAPTVSPPAPSQPAIQPRTAPRPLGGTAYTEPLTAPTTPATQPVDIEARRALGLPPHGIFAADPTAPPPQPVTPSEKVGLPPISTQGTRPDVANQVEATDPNNLAAAIRAEYPSVQPRTIERPTIVTPPEMTPEQRDLARTDRNAVASSHFNAARIYREQEKYVEADREDAKGREILQGGGSAPPPTASGMAEQPQGAMTETEKETMANLDERVANLKLPEFSHTGVTAPLGKVFDNTKNVGISMEKIISEIDDIFRSAPQGYAMRIANKIAESLQYKTMVAAIAEYELAIKKHKYDSPAFSESKATMELKLKKMRQIFNMVDTTRDASFEDWKRRRMYGR